MSKLTISLVTYNSEKYLRDFCISLREQTFGDWDLIAIDNASHDRSVAVLREHLPHAHIVQQKTNIGFSRAHNLAITWSKTAYVLVVNPDVFFDPHCIERIVRYLDRFPEVSSAGPKLLAWDYLNFVSRGTIDSCGIRLTPVYRASDRLQGQPDRELQSGRVFGISGACVAYRRDPLEDVKIPRIGESGSEYFDEDFFAYKEDVDLAWRLNLAGYEQHVVADAIAYHQRAISGQAASRAERRRRSGINRLSYRNHLLMVYKNHQWRLTLRHLIPLVWFEACKYVYLIFLDGSSLRGLGEVMRLLPKFRKKRIFVRAHIRIKPKSMAKLLH